MINPNQPIRGNFGDIFTPNTSYTDRLSQQLYAEQKQKEQNQLLENRRLDEEFARNMSGIRDVDIPDLTKAYGDWKLASQSLYNQKGINPDQQLDLLRKKANVYDIINKSKNVRAKELEVRKLADTHIENLADDYLPSLQKSMSTPLSKGNNFLEYNHLYNGANYPNAGVDYGRAMKLAELTPTDEGVLDKGGLGKNYTTYKTINPVKFKNAMAETLLNPKARKAANFELMNLPENELVETQEAFKAIPDDKLKLMGIKREELLYDPNRPDDKAHIYTTYKAQKAALSNLPQVQGAPKYVPNVKDTFDYKRAEGFKDWLKKNKITSDQKDARVLANKAGDPTVPFPLDEFEKDYGVVHEIKDADGKTISTMNIVYEDALPSGKLNRYNKLIRTEDGYNKEVEPLKDEKGRKYYILSRNDEGHTELGGKKGKLEATESRNREIINVPSNKSKQGIYFNKGESKPTKKDSLGILGD